MATELNQKESEKSLDTLLAPAALSISPNYMQIGQKMAKTLFFATYPRYLNTNWLSPIINLDQVMDLAIHILPKNTGSVLKQLRDQLARLESQAMEEASKGKVRDPVLDTAMADIEALRDKLQQGTDRFFEVGVYLTIYADDLKKLAESENKIKGILDSQLVFSKPAIFRMGEGLSSTVPLDDDKLNVHTSLNTEPLSSFFPFVSFELSSNSGVLYGVNTHNNSLVLFDRFTLENANEVIFGKSGSGKSYGIKLEILRSLIFVVQTIIIDPEDEYKYLAETVGGSVIKISINSDNHVNPFDLPAPKEDESFLDVFRSHVVNLTGLLRLILGDLTPEESSVLDDAIMQTYALKDITPESDYTKGEPPLMIDLQNILEGLAGAESMALRLKKYTHGTFAGFLNQPTNVNLSSQIVVFSIKEMEEELRPIAMYLVLNYIWVTIRRGRKKRMLMVDEAWLLLKYPLGAEFLSNIAKRARKYYAGLTTISQDIPDLLALPQARVGFGLFFLGQNHIGIRIVASYPEDQIITSDPKQLIELEKAKEEWAKLQK